MPSALREFSSSATGRIAANTAIAFAATAAAITVPTAANAQTNGPIRPNTCFTDDASGRAVEKLQAALKARNQEIILTADQGIPLVENGKRVFDKNGDPVTILKEVIYTSRPDRKEGYPVYSNVAGGSVGSRYCVGNLYSDVNVYNAYTQKSVPSEVNVGELGVHLVGSRSVKQHVAMTGKTYLGTIFAITVNIDNQNAYGSEMLARADGSKTGTLAYYKNVFFSDKTAKELGIQYADAKR